MAEKQFCPFAPVFPYNESRVCDESCPLFVKGDNAYLRGCSFKVLALESVMMGKDIYSLLQTYAKAEGVDIVKGISQTRRE